MESTPILSSRDLLSRDTGFFSASAVKHWRTRIKEYSFTPIPELGISFFVTSDKAYRGDRALSLRYVQWDSGSTYTFLFQGYSVNSGRAAINACKRVQKWIAAHYTEVKGDFDKMSESDLQSISFSDIDTTHRGIRNFVLKMLYYTSAGGE